MSVSVVGKMAITKALGKGKTSSKGLVYFLHGACDDGAGMQTWINKTINGNFAFRQFPILYPSSPVRSYSVHDGKKESVWFDQLALSPNVPEDFLTINAIGSQICQLIDRGEKESGIPARNTIIGGFSMGGAMAMHLGYKFQPDIAGVFALSSFLPPDSHLFETLDRRNKNLETECTENARKSSRFPKLFMSHGKEDPIVPIRWAKTTFHNLRKRGIEGQFYTIENSQHSLNKNQLGLLHDWIEKTLDSKTQPEITTDNDTEIPKTKNE